MSQGLPPAHGAPQPYDYRAAAQSLNSLIDRLRPGAQPGGPDAPSQIASAMRFWRGNWRSVLALLTLYSIPTGAVMALVFAQRQTRVRARAKRRARARADAPVPPLPRGLRPVGHCMHFAGSTRAEPAMNELTTCFLVSTRESHPLEPRKTPPGGPALV